MVTSAAARNAEREEGSLQDFTCDAWLCIQAGEVVNVEVMEAGARGYASGANPPVEVRKVRLKMAG